MKIVTLEKFRKLPQGTLFMKYQPCVFDNLNAKGETWDGDFLYENVTCEIHCTGDDDFANRLNSAQETDESLLMDFNATDRDGCFDEDQLFAVYDKRDIEMLIGKLNRCKKLAYI
jgi:hypothetical protein